MKGIVGDTYEHMSRGEDAKCVSDVKTFGGSGGYLLKVHEGILPIAGHKLETWLASLFVRLFLKTTIHFFGVIRLHLRSLQLNTGSRRLTGRSSFARFNSTSPQSPSNPTSINARLNHDPSKFQVPYQNHNTIPLTARTTDYPRGNGIPQDTSTILKPMQHAGDSFHMFSYLNASTDNNNVSSRKPAIHTHFRKPMHAM